MNTPTAFISTSDLVARATEVPNASWSDGCNVSGSNANGIGINIGGGALGGGAQQFTLLDQNGAPRTPQLTQHIGGTGFTDQQNVYPLSGGNEGFNGASEVGVVQNDAEGKGAVTVLGAASLATLAAGWTAAALLEAEAEDEDPVEPTE